MFMFVLVYHLLFYLPWSRGFDKFFMLTVVTLVNFCNFFCFVYSCPHTLWIYWFDCACPRLHISRYWTLMLHFNCMPIAILFSELISHDPVVLYLACRLLSILLDDTILKNFLSFTSAWSPGTQQFLWIFRVLFLWWKQRNK